MAISKSTSSDAVRRLRDIKVVVDGRRTREYRVRVERAIGRKLTKRECVHHHTKDVLVACEDQAYHLLLHARARVVRAGGNPNTQRICGKCNLLKLRSEFSPWVNGQLSYTCKQCRSEYELRRYYKRQGRNMPCRS